MSCCGVETCALQLVDLSLKVRALVLSNLNSTNVAKIMPKAAKDDSIFEHR